MGQISVHYIGNSRIDIGLWPQRFRYTLSIAAAFKSETEYAKPMLHVRGDAAESGQDAREMEEAIEQLLTPSVVSMGGQGLTHDPLLLLLLLLLLPSTHPTPPHPTRRVG